MAGLATVEMTLTGARPGRPPKETLYVDVLLQNESDQPRWFLVPDQARTIPDADGEGSNTAIDYRVSFVNVYRMVDQGQVIAGHFAGPRGFFAFYLPARAVVRLENLPLALWQPLGDHFYLTVRSAAEVWVAGQAAGDWFGMDPLSEPGALVDVTALADQAGVIESATIPRAERSAVRLAGEEAIDIRLPLTI